MATPRDKYMPPLPSPDRKKKKKNKKLPGYEDSDIDEEEEEEAVKVARREALAPLLRDDLKTPYLTCQRCNSVTFINVNRVRPRRYDPDEPLSHYEQLPVCSGCGTTKYLRAGVTSFHEKIAEEQQKIKEFERKRVPATQLLQRVARGFLGRLAFRRKKWERELYERRISNAATRIQSHVRGMQARRRTLYERCLRIIRTMHPSILQHALATRPDAPPVFWYDNPGELQILHWNYREYVRRSGGKPPLVKVESNIMEVTRRMLLREHELVSRIQSRWRGLTTRLVFVEFKRQRGWLRGLQQSPAIKIQRLYRAHSAKRRCSALRAIKAYPDHMAAYKNERQEKQKQEKATAFRKKLLAKYRIAYQTNRTSKMLALQASDQPESNGEEEEEKQMPKDERHSLRAPNDGKVIERQQKQLVLSANAHPNARKFAELKRLANTQKLRGPRLHILNAQEYTVSREEKDSS